MRLPPPTETLYMSDLDELDINALPHDGYNTTKLVFTNSHGAESFHIFIERGGKFGDDDRKLWIDSRGCRMPTWDSLGVEVAFYGAHEDMAKDLFPFMSLCARTGIWIPHTAFKQMRDREAEPFLGVLQSELYEINWPEPQYAGDNDVH